MIVTAVLAEGKLASIHRKSSTRWTHCVLGTAPVLRLSVEVMKEHRVAVKDAHGTPFV